MDDYTYCLQQQRKAQPAPLQVFRDWNTLPLSPIHLSLPLRGDGNSLPSAVSASTPTRQTTALICHTANSQSIGDIFWAKDQFLPPFPLFPNIRVSLTSIYSFLFVCASGCVCVSKCIDVSARTCIRAWGCWCDVCECNLIMSYSMCMLQQCCNNPWIMARPPPDSQRAH